MPSVSRSVSAAPKIYAARRRSRLTLHLSFNLPDGDRRTPNPLRERGLSQIERSTLTLQPGTE